MSKARISENPHFGNIERAPYELGYLLKQLPSDFSAFAPASEESLQIAQAAAEHAGNAHHTLLHGLEAIGELMYLAATNEDNEIGKSTIADLGYAIKHLAVEMQMLQHIGSDLQRAVSEHRSSTKKARK